MFQISTWIDHLINDFPVVPPNYSKVRFFFCLKFIVGFPLVGLIWTGLIFYFSDSKSLNFRIAYWIGSIGISLGLSCLIFQNVYQLIRKTWDKIIILVDTLITWIILPIFFYTLFSPYGFMLQILGKAKMKSKSHKKSFWIDIEHPKSKSQYFRQF
jgi:hypothetical protein